MNLTFFSKFMFLFVFQVMLKKFVDKTSWYVYVIFYSVDIVLFFRYLYQYALKALSYKLMTAQYCVLTTIGTCSCVQMHYYTQKFISLFRVKNCTPIYSRLMHNCFNINRCLHLYLKVEHFRRLHFIQLYVPKISKYVHFLWETMFNFIHLFRAKKQYTYSF